MALIKKIEPKKTTIFTSEQQVIKLKKQNPINLDASATAFLMQTKDILKAQGIRAPSYSDAVRYLAQQASIEADLKYLEE